MQAACPFVKSSSRGFRLRDSLARSQRCLCRVCKNRIGWTRNLPRLQRYAQAQLGRLPRDALGHRPAMPRQCAGNMTVPAFSPRHAFARRPYRRLSRTTRTLVAGQPRTRAYSTAAMNRRLPFVAGAVRFRRVLRAPWRQPARATRLTACGKSVEVNDPHRRRPITREPCVLRRVSKSRSGLREIGLARARRAVARGARYLPHPGVRNDRRQRPGSSAVRHKPITPTLSISPSRRESPPRRVAPGHVSARGGPVPLR